MHLIHAKYKIISPSGETVQEQPELISNFLAQEGEQSILNVYLLGQTLPSLYLCLLSATPTATTTMATMTEAQTPGSNGYNRQQILTTDWSTPLLNNGDYQTNAATKTFGPASGANWTNISYAALVTTATGTAGKFIAAVALQAPETVTIGNSIIYLLTTKAFSVP